MTPRQKKKRDVTHHNTETEGFAGQHTEEFHFIQKWCKGCDGAGFFHKSVKTKLPDVILEYVHNALYAS